MDEERDRRGGLLRAAACLAASGTAVVVTGLLDAPPLDRALWGVLAPILVGSALEALQRVRRRVARRLRAEVVVPDAVALVPMTPDPAVQARQAAADQARAALLAAQQRDAAAEELLALAEAQHEAALDLARATAAAGGYVPQELRDELAVRAQRITPPLPSG